jgi:CheY-like chemotaxis protein
MNVSHADDGDRALERLMVDGGYDLVITDLNMPRMDGVQLLVKIRATEQLRRTKVIVVSGGGRLQEALSSGADAVLQKPFPLEELEAEITRLFP